MPYSPLMIKPMREELAAAGFEALMTPADVDRFLGEASGTALLVVNSVCGCAAGMARPGARLALQSGPRPERLGTVFAGQDLEATARARQLFGEIPPSSPSMALFKDGGLVWFLPRHRIEGRDALGLRRALRDRAGRLTVAKMGTFHQDTHELHGITVVVETDGPELWIGRCHSWDERALVLHDADVHREGESERPRAEWLERAGRFGVWPRHRRISLAAERVASVRRLGES
jgi:putative YphP/YqiW family bacilliredoxin